MNMFLRFQVFLFPYENVHRNEKGPNSFIACGTRHDMRLETLGREKGTEHVAASCKTSTFITEVPDSNLCRYTFYED
jgi:hypothetical protein